MLRDISAGPACGGNKAEPGERGWRSGSKRGRWRGMNGEGSVGGEVEVEIGVLGVW